MPPDEPNDEEAREQLPEDGETPFRPASDSRSDLGDQNLEREVRGERAGDQHPSRDSNQEREELYDEGAGIMEPNAGSAVEGYDPAKDQRRQQPSSR